MHIFFPVKDAADFFPSKLGIEYGKYFMYPGTTQNSNQLLYKLLALHSHLNTFFSKNQFRFQTTYFCYCRKINLVNGFNSNETKHNNVFKTSKQTI